MRKITTEIVQAFENHVPLTKGNSSTTGEILTLHGNVIARHSPRGLEVSNAGWQSNTTKERLNGLRGVRINQVKGEWFLNGQAWSGAWARPLSTGFEYVA